MEDLEYGSSSHIVEELKETLSPSRNSGNNFVLDPTSIEQDHEQSQPRQNNHE